jgi:hypothetical protein
MPLVLPVPPSRARDGSHQRQSKRNIKNGKREDQHSRRKKRNHRYQLCMMHHVVKDQQQQSRRDYRQTTVQRVAETKVLPVHKAPSPHQKQQAPGCNHGPWSPCDVSRSGLVRVHYMIPLAVLVPPMLRQNNILCRLPSWEARGSGATEGASNLLVWRFSTAKQLHAKHYGLETKTMSATPTRHALNRSSWRKGLDVENHPSLRLGEKTILLTSFYRTQPSGIGCGTRFRVDKTGEKCGTWARFHVPSRSLALPQGCHSDSSLSRQNPVSTRRSTAGRRDLSASRRTPRGMALRSDFGMSEPEKISH